MSRSYKEAAALAAEVVRLAGAARDQARAGREHADLLEADRSRIGAAIDAIDAAGGDTIGESDVAIVTGGDLEYLAALEQSGSVAIYDDGHPDTSVGEGFVPDRKVLLCQFLVARGVQETRKGSRDELAQALVDEGYRTEQGSLDFPHPVRFAAKAIEGAERDFDAIALYMLDDETGAGVRLCAIGVPKGSAGMPGEVTPELEHAVTPEGKAAVVMVRRGPTNEFDPGDEYAVIVPWEAQDRFAAALAAASYAEAVARAAEKDYVRATVALAVVGGIPFPAAEQLMLRARNDGRFAAIRSTLGYAQLVKTTFPTSSRYGLDEAFAQYACDVLHAGLDANLDTGALAKFGDFAERIRAAANGRANFAAGAAIVTWPCGTACQSGAMVDFEDGGVVGLPGPAWGYEYRVGSTLLVVNPPQSLEGDKYGPRSARPAYYTWTGGRFDLLADTSVRRGK